MAEESAGVYPITRGWVFLAASGKGITRVGLPRPTRAQALAAADWRGPLDGAPPLRRLARKIERYYAGHAVRFTEPVDLSGMGAFGRAVLRATRAIPRGQVRTYGEIARQIGRPRAARAVGQALHRNPVPLLVPCHRVIGAGGPSLRSGSPRRAKGAPSQAPTWGGRLVGFGSGIQEKRRLLCLEGAWPPERRG